MPRVIGSRVTKYVLRAYEKFNEIKVSSHYASQNANYFRKSEGMVFTPLHGGELGIASIFSATRCQTFSEVGWRYPFWGLELI